MGCLNQKQVAEELKVVLLGLGGSGKSTILKQLKFIYSDQLAYTPEQLLNFKQVLCYNLVMAIRSLVSCIQVNEIKSKKTRTFMKKLGYQVREDDALLKSCKEFWENEEVQRILEQYNLDQLDEEYNFYYCIDNLERIISEDFTPNEKDIINARLRTTGIENVTLQQDEPRIAWQFSDAGGQQSEVRKWELYINNFHACIYCVALDSFDKKEKDDKVTMLEHSIELFTQLYDEYSSKITFIIFLNKLDLLQKKLKQGDFKSIFPEYKGKKRNWEQASTHIAEIFKQDRPDLCVHIGCALEKDLIQKVFAQIMQTIIKARLEVL